MMLYSIAITNTVESFMVNQLSLEAWVPHRAILSLILILALMAVVRAGADLVVKAMSLLVYPFITALMVLGIYLVPEWSLDTITTAGRFTDALQDGVFGKLSGSAFLSWCLPLTTQPSFHLLP